MFPSVLLTLHMEYQIQNSVDTLFSYYYIEKNISKMKMLSLYMKSTDASY